MANLYTPENLVQVITEDGMSLRHFRHILTSNFNLIKDYFDEFPEHRSIDLFCQQEDFLAILNYFDRNIYPQSEEDWRRIVSVVEYLNPPLTHLNRLYLGALGYLEKRDSKNYRGQSITHEDAFKKILDPTYLTALEVQERHAQRMRDLDGEIEVQGVCVGHDTIRYHVEPPTLRQRMSRFFGL